MYLIPLGAKIKKQRESLGLSRYKLSVMANLGKYAVARMEKENHKVHILRAKALCEILGCDLHDLFKEG